MKKNPLSNAQLTSLGNYIIFDQKDVKVYQNFIVLGTPIIERQHLDSIYVPIESTYIDKIMKNETVEHMKDLDMLNIVN